MAIVGQQEPNSKRRKDDNHLEHKTVVDSKNNKSERDLVLDLTVSDMNLVRVFVAVAKSAYDLGKFDASEFARSKAMKFYCQAFRSVRQMPEADRELFSSDLQNLCTQIRWLSVRTDAPQDSCPEMDEEASMETLLRLLREGG
jgi:hypothetical protein